MKSLLLFATALLPFSVARSAETPRPRVPIMGWSSWNHYRIHIDENLIRSQADAMSSNGMTKFGYRFLNIDDGFFGGRDAAGKLLSNDKFPNGMRHLSDYIRKKGLKPGIYAEAGKNTCGSQYDNDKLGLGSGLFGHEQQDIEQMLVEWNYDFLKVDWCGALLQKLDPKTQYTKIGDIIHRLRPDAVYNICRWQYPGDWVQYTSDSWRISGDIEASFKSVMSIVDKCEPLWVHCSPGHFNDMDMLQVGRGMTADEDRAHFTMWCMMVSPLLAGNDLTTMNKQSLEILTNAEIIALNQDPLCYQARRLRDDGDHELWAKPLKSTDSGEVAVTLLNRGSASADLTFQLAEVGIDAARGYAIRDLWAGKILGRKVTKDAQTFSVPAHGVVTLRIRGTVAAENPFAAPFGWKYSNWCAQHDLTGENAEIHADPDGDGIPNLLEYAFDGGDPLRKDGDISTIKAEGGAYRFTPRRTADVQFVPQAEAAEGNWFSDETGARIAIPTTAGTMFLRMAASVTDGTDAANLSFESPPQAAGKYSTGNPPGWTFTGESGGVENVNEAARYGDAAKFGEDDAKLEGQGGEGNQVGFINLGAAGGGADASATSVVLAKVEPATTYTVTIAFAQRASGVRMPEGAFGLQAGGANVGDFTKIAGAGMATGFHDFTYSWTSPGAGDALIGQPLRVRMDFRRAAVAGWQQAQFDRVRFSKTPAR